MTLASDELQVLEALRAVKAAGHGTVTVDVRQHRTEYIDRMTKTKISQ